MVSLNAMTVESLGWTPESLTVLFEKAPPSLRGFELKRYLTGCKSVTVKERGPMKRPVLVAFD